MENEILISVIVPCYNLGDYINSCIESLYKQSNQNLEYIMVNDGSSDSTLNKLKEFRRKDKRVVLINKDNAGVAEARNDALKIARGKYVFFLDGDDFIEFDTCEKMYNLIENQSADLLIFDFQTVSTDGITRIYKTHIPIGTYTLDRFFCVVDTLPVSPKLYKNDIIKKNGLFFESNIVYGEVFTFFFRYLAYTQKIVVTDNVFYNCFEREMSASRSLDYKKEKNILNTIKLLKHSTELYANIDIKGMLCYHKALYNLVRTLVLFKYISLNLTYDNVKYIFKEIYGNILIKENLKFIKENVSFFSPHKYITLLLMNPSRLSYYILTYIYKYKLKK